MTGKFEESKCESTATVAELSLTTRLIPSWSSGGENDLLAHQRGSLLFDVYETWTFFPTTTWFFYLNIVEGRELLLSHVGPTAESSSSSLQEAESTVEGFLVVFCGV